MTYPVIPDNY